MAIFIFFSLVVLISVWLPSLIFSFFAGSRSFPGVSLLFPPDQPSGLSPNRPTRLPLRNVESGFGLPFHDSLKARTGVFWNDITKERDQEALFLPEAEDFSSPAPCVPGTPCPPFVI
jgi:hypothetical protein